MLNGILHEGIDRERELPLVIGALKRELLNSVTNILHDGIRGAAPDVIQAALSKTVVSPSLDSVARVSWQDVFEAILEQEVSDRFVDELNDRDLLSGDFGQALG